MERVDVFLGLGSNLGDRDFRVVHLFQGRDHGRVKGLQFLHVLCG